MQKFFIPSKAKLSILLYQNDICLSVCLYICLSSIYLLYLSIRPTLSLESLRYLHIRRENCPPVRRFGSSHPHLALSDLYLDGCPGSSCKQQQCIFQHLIFLNQKINTYLMLEIRVVCREVLAFKYAFFVFLIIIYICTKENFETQCPFIFVLTGKEY